MSPNYSYLLQKLRGIIGRGLFILNINCMWGSQMELHRPLTLFKPRYDDYDIGNCLTRITPAMHQLSREEQTITLLKQIVLPINFEIYIPAQSKNKFMTGMQHTVRTTAGTAFQGHHEGFHTANK